MNELRLALVLAGLLLLVAIWYFGRHPRNGWWGKHAEGESGARIPPAAGPPAPAAPAHTDEPAQAQAELELTHDAVQATPPPAPGQRPQVDFERIVSIYLAAKDARTLRGADIAVAAEKVGLTYGHLDIFHRLLDSAPECGPVFSVANLKQPNSFPLDGMATLETPGIVLFLTLPAPLPALDAWNMLLPTAQRLAELLDAVLLDEQRSALTRQRIASIRDELREWDRQHPPA